MTRWQSHSGHISHIPGTYNEAPRIGIFPYLLDELRNLVYMFSVACIPGTPLMPVNRSEVAVFIRPFIPNTYAIFFQVFYVGIALQNPQQFVYDGLGMEFFCGQ